MVLICHVTSQNHVIKRSCDFMCKSYQGKLLSSKFQWPQALWQWEYNSFSLSDDLARSRDQSVIWLDVQKPLKVSHNLPRFRLVETLPSLGQSQSSQVQWRQGLWQGRHNDFRVKGSCDFIGGSPSWLVIIIQSLVVIGVVVVVICFQWLKSKIPHPLLRFILIGHGLKAHKICLVHTAS